MDDETLNPFMTNKILQNRKKLKKSLIDNTVEAETLLPLARPQAQKC